MVRYQKGSNRAVTDAGAGAPVEASPSESRAGSPKITVFLADDSLLVREGVRALLAAQPDLEVVGVAEDFDGLVAGAEQAEPQVVVTDIRMPPNFQNEGIEAAKLVRKRHPGTGVVVLSQYDEPEYAISLLSEGAAGYAYLLKDRVGDGDEPVEVLGDADDFEIGLRGEQRAHAFAHEQRVVGEEDRDLRRAGAAFRRRCFDGRTRPCVCHCPIGTFLMPDHKGGLHRSPLVLAPPPGDERTPW